MAEPRNAHGGPHSAIAHDSARKQLCGTASYIDDLPELPGTLMAYPVPARPAHATIASLDVAAARTAPGVHAVLTVGDVPGHADIGPIRPGDPVLADGTVHFSGQPIAVIAAETIAAARAAAARIDVDYEELPAILTIADAWRHGSFVSDPLTMRIGDAAAAIAGAPHVLSGELDIGGQDHFYLEGQVAYALPGEDGDILCYSSTQHPSEVQHLIAHVLGRPTHAVTVEVRRMGGGFGGKETQATQWACLAALLADKTGRPVKLRLDRDDDMIMTGKRHGFLARYRVGFGAEGRIHGIELDLAGNAGMSADLTDPVVDRAMFHADNCYFLGHARVTGYRCRTNTVSNTAFRGFGGPQGMVAIEYVVDEIARSLGRDPLLVRKANFYDPAGAVGDRATTHYHMKVTDNIAPRIVDRLERDSLYWQRRAEIDAANRHSPHIKRGLALTPVKFGISFTVTHLNQAGALIQVYQDGSVQLNHGGTEMGQGVNIKVAQVVAGIFQVDIDRIRITAASTGKVPNTSATAASSGADLNGQAARNAALAIRNRMVDHLSNHFKTPAEHIVFKGNTVSIGMESLTFSEVCRLCYFGRVSLSATGFYKTPKIWWDRTRAVGRPFLYFAYGAAVSEVVLDTLTGEYRTLRADIVHDCGDSLNPAVDLGQVEGAFVQGAGWLTMEELVWDADGRLRTHAPSTYKIPATHDMPDIFNVALIEGLPNREDVIGGSKAVGEPPLMLGISVYLALKDAVSAATDHRVMPHLDAPATPERVLMAIGRARERLAKEDRAAE